MPIWLFSTVEPLAETLTLCEQVEVNPSARTLFLHAERRLWPYWVALGLVTWTGGRGRWPLKLAPFLIPPFRILVLNENGDFFPGSLGRILNHCVRRVRMPCSPVGAAHWIWAVPTGIWSRTTSGCRARDARQRRNRGHLFAVDVAVSACGHGRTEIGAFFPRQEWFQHIHGSDRLAPAEPGVTEPAMGAPPSALVWPGHTGTSASSTASCASEARWLVWQESGEADAPIEDMLPLFDDPRTFAVSRQSHFRAWKPMLFPMAPFRTFQPGEASQVLAPLSETVVVDRRKLLALGIPHCSLAGTAWMVLFWKAAAAGWRSYSVGQGKRLREQPDFPMQETGFLLRIITDSGLRRLGPHEPDLARGSIAFAANAPVPPPRPPGPARLKVLVLSPFLPYPLSHGGAVRMYNLCRALADRVDFVLAAFRESQDEIHYDKLHEVFREVYVVDKDERASHDRRLPEQVRQHQSRALRALAGKLARRWTPDLLQVEYTHLAAVRDAVPGVPAILVEHDLTFSLYRQLAEKKGATQAAQLEYQRWRDFETHWLRTYDGVWTVSGDDRQSAIQEGGRAASHTFVVANGVDIQRFVPCEEATPAPEIFYVGSFRHLPNVLGFQKLREEVMPRVWRGFPDARLRVVAGPQQELFWNRFAPRDQARQFDPRIEIHGFVEDLRPLYARAAVVVVPLEVSAGTNIKVLEAMACGKAVVTTPIGCAGLDLKDRVDAWIDVDWAAFAESIAELLSNRAVRRRTGARARRTVEERFSWTVIADQAYESYRALDRSSRSAIA